MAKGFVEVNGARLAYEAEGSGTPIIMVHAGIADMTMWDPQFEAWKSRYQVIRYDARNYGDSEHTGDTIFSNRDDLLAVLNEVGAEKAVVMGCSRGGQIATDFTLEYPDRVKALIPVCAGIGGADYPDFVFPPEEMALEEVYEKAEQDGEWDKAADLGVQIWADGFRRSNKAPDAVREKVRAMSLKLYHKPENGSTPIVLAPPAFLRLHEIQVPALVIIGENDEMICLEFADKLAADIKNSLKVMVKDAAHLPNMEHPDLFNKIVADFVDGLPA